LVSRSFDRILIVFAASVEYKSGGVLCRSRYRRC